jgi:hypothetical protein
VANKIISYTVHGLGGAASTQTFMWKKKKEKENELVTVENYFRKNYGTELRLVY